MGKYFVKSTIKYIGVNEVEAENENSAIEKVKEMIHNDNGNDVPVFFSCGGVDFEFKELTTDYAEEID